MENAMLILLGIQTLALIFAGLFLRSYLPSYFSEKGKNLASKEDLANLTNIVENIKVLHTSELERLKAKLLAESQITERRRRLYEEMCMALRVFTSGHATPEIKEKFHITYATAWLWASDSVLIALNDFIALQARHTANPTSTNQIEMKKSYSIIILEMRKDVGFDNTTVEGTDYQFTQFQNEP